jgi:eukaryotic-like serine/threonine-protein kinase
MSMMIGQYEVLELLGEGGIGQVHVARDTVLGREVAIKSLRPELLNDTSFVERFRAEATNLARLNHPNITTLYTLLAEGKQLYMVMELVHGRTLETILRERHGPFAQREAIAIISQASEGLSYAHGMGVIHRDIKPANMIITGSGLLKIMDFGIARVQGSQRLTRDGTIVGTLAYMAPEQLRAEEVDARADLYSLAIVFYEMLSGTVPFTAASDYDLMRAQIHTSPERLAHRVTGLDPQIEKALLRALSKKPEERFPTVAAFRDALGASIARSEVEQLTQNATRIGALLPLIDPPVVRAARTRAPASPIFRGFAIGTGVMMAAGAVILLVRASVTPPSIVSSVNATKTGGHMSPVVAVASNPGPVASTGAVLAENQKQASLPDQNSVSDATPAPTATTPSGQTANNDADSAVGSLPADQNSSNPQVTDVRAAYYERNDYQAARALAEPLAKNGDPECQFIMGILYDDGLGGLTKDSYRAFDWYQKSANQGYAKAQFNLAIMFDNGEGTPPDKAEAFKWYYRAAEKGYPSAQLNVGLIYRRGIGVDRNDQLARTWLSKAAASSDSDIAQKAKAALDQIAGKGR